MKALAEFVMQGRLQACLAAFVGGFLPVIGGAVVALVALRMGVWQSLSVFAWAFVPPLLTFSDSQNQPFLALISVSPLVVLLVVWVCSALLRASQSWPMILFVLVLLCIGASGLMALVLPEAVTSASNTLLQAMTEFRNELEANRPPVEGAAGNIQHAAPEVDASLVLGLLGYSNALNALASLLLARWWQAGLYNPGGFRQEMHQLRLPAMIAAPLWLAMVLLGPFGGLAAGWESLVGLPLVCCGLALVHWIVQWRKMGTGWLVACYVLVVLSGPFAIFLMTVAVLDSFFGLREQLVKRQA